MTNDVLLNYITACSRLTTEDFYKVFENIFFEKFPSYSLNESISHRKRSSINLYDYLGYCDFDYKSRKVQVCEPQLIVLPRTGNKIRCFLTGARTQTLVDKISSYCNTSEAKMEISSCADDNRFYLLPDTIIIEAESLKSIEDLTSNCGIKFSHNILYQAALFELSANIKEYENELEIEDHHYENGWSIKVFNPSSLKFEAVSNFNKAYTLIEYKFDEYRLEYVLWKNGSPHHVDKSWGRYLVLNHFNKDVILNDKTKSIIGVPTSTPLPKLMAKALILLSGKAPEKKLIKVDNKDRYYFLYTGAAHIFAYNYLKEKLQQNIDNNLINIQA